MNEDVISLIRAIVRDQLKAFKTAELGIVTRAYPHESATDKNNYECDVRLRDSGLELKRVPVSTQRVGAVMMPNKDDLVLIQYLNGDIHSALITGRLYNDKERPPLAKSHEAVYISPDSNEKGIRRIYLELPNNNNLLVDDDKLELKMGKTTVTVNHNGEIVINSKEKVVIESPQIELVSGATHPSVFGDKLLQYLNQLGQIYQAHTHPGEMALGVFPVTPMTPVPPFPPATPDLLSTKVKTG
jgi:phage baseplate assembly protein gpV